MHPLGVRLEEIEPLVNEDDVEDRFPADGVGKGSRAVLLRRLGGDGDGVEDLKSFLEV